MREVALTTGAKYQMTNTWGWEGKGLCAHAKGKAHTPLLQQTAAPARGGHVGKYKVFPDSLASKDELEIWILMRDIFTIKC